MKIHLKTTITPKRLFVLSVSMIIIIGTVLTYFFTGTSAPDTRSSNSLPDTRSGQVAAKPRQTSIREKITVITPVNVVDDAFKEYDLNKGSKTEVPAVVEQKPVQDSSNAPVAREELAAQLPQMEKAAKQTPAEMKQERMKGKEANPRESTGDVSAASPVNPAGKDDAAGAKSAAQDEGL